MPENNELINNQGLEMPEDPNSFAPDPEGEFAQSGPRDRVRRMVDTKSTSIETIPVYFKLAVMSLIQAHLQDDEIFRYIPGDPRASGCVITAGFNRATVEARDQKPLIAVIGMGMQPQELVLRNAFQGSPNQGPMREQRGVMSHVGVRVAIIHHNPNVCELLGSFIQGWIAANTQLFREMFSLQKVYMPTLSETGEVDQLPDVFGTYVTVQAEVVPKWLQGKDQALINRIYVTINANMGTMIQEMILTPQPGA